MNVHDFLWIHMTFQRSIREAHSWISLSQPLPPNTTNSHRRIPMLIINKQWW